MLECRVSCVNGSGSERWKRRLSRGKSGSSNVDRLGLFEGREGFLMGR